MTIERSQNMAGSVVSYDISTEVRYRVILELLVNYSLNEVFENGILTKGQGSSTINGSIQNESTRFNKLHSYSNEKQVINRYETKFSNQTRNR